MNRVLSLQGLTASELGIAPDTKSAQSNWCSSATTACSTQSNACGAQQFALAW
ncbi:MAG: hypothetical protein GY854_29395 [Deltaproteobacteria bacterium]|nr:hypothetical protein [Deltaproteobacteria bacterium]